MVDATENNELAKQFGITGFPTLKWFNNKTPSDYNGGRTENEIVQWINKKSGPPAKTVESVQDLDKYTSESVYVIGLFADKESENAKKFLEAASQDDNNIYLISSSADVFAKYNVNGDSVVLIKDFDEKRNDLTISAETSSADVKSFVADNSIPLIQVFSAESAKKIFSSSITKHALFFTKEANEESQKAYRASAEAFKGKLLFVNVPISEKRIADFFEVTEDKLPALVVADLGNPSGMKKYPFNGNHVEAEINAHVNAVLDGSAKPFLKSEEPTPEDLTGDVVVLKGKSFNDLVIDNDNDVIVKFYAPWCGHCQKLAPTWEELGKKVKSSSNGKVVVAKIDSTANEIDVPGVSVKGFPTIYFFKGGDKQNPIRYEEGRDLDSFYNFLTKNAHNSLSHDEL